MLREVARESLELRQVLSGLFGEAYEHRQIIWKKHIDINKRCNQNNIFLWAKGLVSFSGLFGLGGCSFCLLACWQSDEKWSVCSTDYRLAAHICWLPYEFGPPVSPCIPCNLSLIPVSGFPFSITLTLDAKDACVFNWPSFEAAKTEGNPDGELSKCRLGM